MSSTIDFRSRDEGVDVCGGRWPRRTTGSAPPVARGINEDTDAAGESSTDEPLVHVSGKIGLVDVGVVLVKSRRLYRLPSHGLHGGHEWLYDGRVVGSVGDKAIYAGEARLGHLRNPCEFLRSRARIVHPTEP